VSLPQLISCQPDTTGTEKTKKQKNENKKSN